MKRVFSTVLALTLLVGLSALAVVARGGNAILGPAEGVARAAAPDAPAAVENYNMIAIPLDARAQIQPFTGEGLGTFLGPDVQQVSKLDPNTQNYLTWFPPIGDGDQFDLTVGGVYMILLGRTARNTVSFVGDVPAQNSIHFSLKRPTGGGCLYNDISLPLDQAAITTPQLLGNAIGNVEQVSEFNATTQNLKTWFPQIGDGDDFAVKIGYPYRLCLSAGGSTTWPPNP